MMRKVLIVDDEKMVRDSICAMLAWNPLQLECAGSCANALEALDFLTEHMPDILLTDIKMPILSGLELIRKAKKMYPALQCVILSGYAEFALAQDAMKQGVQFYLLKPCQKEELLRVLEQCCTILDKQNASAEQQFDQRQQAIEALREKINLLRAHRSRPVTGQELEQLTRPYEDPSILQEAISRIAVEFSQSSQLRPLLTQLSRTDHTRAQIFSCAAQVLADLPGGAEHADFIQTIKQYVEQNYANPDITLQMMADQVVHMNVQYIGKSFFKETGQYFSDFLMKVRLDNAKILLRSPGEIKINTIAEQIGFEDHVRYFYQVFKKQVGLTPKEYREQKKKS